MERGGLVDTRPRRALGVIAPDQSSCGASSHGARGAHAFSQWPRFAVVGWATPARDFFTIVLGLRAILGHARAYKVPRNWRQT